MANFFTSFLNILKGFITGVSGFWSWFTSPLDALNAFGVEVAPIMIFSFAAFLVVFGLVLGHLLNPLG